MGDALDDYRAMWRSMPWWRRFAHQVWWRAATVWAGLSGGIGPGETLILRAWQRDHDESEAP